MNAYEARTLAGELLGGKTMDVEQVFDIIRELAAYYDESANNQCYLTYSAKIDGDVLNNVHGQRAVMREFIMNMCSTNIDTIFECCDMTQEDDFKRNQVGLSATLILKRPKFGGEE